METRCSSVRPFQRMAMLRLQVVAQPTQDPANKTSARIRARAGSGSSGRRVLLAASCNRSHYCESFRPRERSRGRCCGTPACQPAASPEPQHTAAPVPRSARDRARAARGSAGPGECVSPARQAGPLHPIPRGARRQSVHALLFADGKRDVQPSPAQARTKAQREQEGPGLDEVDD